LLEKHRYLVRYIKRKFGVTYCLDNIYRRLNSLRFSWITSRSKHPKQSQEIQECFKKIQIEMLPKDHDRSSIDIWFQEVAKTE
jgi:hypothetical protein